MLSIDMYIRFVECSNKILNKNRTKNCSDGVDDKGDNDDDVESDMMIIGEDGDDKYSRIMMG